MLNARYNIHMVTPPKLVRQIIVAAIGIPLLILGLILIPLPGPGLLVSFIALIVLAAEFDSLKPMRDKLKHKLKKVIVKAKERQDRINKKLE